MTETVEEPRVAPRQPTPGMSVDGLAAAIAKGVAADLAKQQPAEPAPVRAVDRPLAQTEEGRMQRVLLAVIVVGAALSGVLEWLQVDATPAYSLMAAGSAALLGNAWLGGKRQEAKATVAESEAYNNVKR